MLSSHSYPPTSRASLRCPLWEVRSFSPVPIWESHSTACKSFDSVITTSTVETTSGTTSLPPVTATPTSTIASTGVPLPQAAWESCSTPTTRSVTVNTLSLTPPQLRMPTLRLSYWDPLARTAECPMYLPLPPAIYLPVVPSTPAWLSRRRQLRTDTLLSP